MIDISELNSQASSLQRTRDDGKALQKAFLDLKSIIYRELNTDEYRAVLFGITPLIFDTTTNLLSNPSNPHTYIKNYGDGQLILGCAPKHYGWLDYKIAQELAERTVIEFGFSSKSITDTLVVVTPGGVIDFGVSDQEGYVRLHEFVTDIVPIDTKYADKKDAEVKIETVISPIFVYSSEYHEGIVKMMKLFGMFATEQYLDKEIERADLLSRQSPISSEREQRRLDRYRPILEALRSSLAEFRRALNQ